MFDDPRKELKKLEDRLLAAEDTGTMEPEGEEDPEQALAEVKQILAKDAWEEERRLPLSESYTARKHVEEERIQVAKTEKRTEPKRSNTGGLAAALLLELLLFLGIIVWWILWR